MATERWVADMAERASSIMGSLSLPTGPSWISPLNMGDSSTIMNVLPAETNASGQQGLDGVFNEGRFSGEGRLQIPIDTGPMLPGAVEERQQLPIPKRRTTRPIPLGGVRPTGNPVMFGTCKEGGHPLRRISLHYDGCPYKCTYYPGRVTA
mmetsp:Transcript_59905/g.106554  ORF Transcript_59905/g.106554 Transcript_59905/m.106554 type:complete len:151 (-) Transcript_59905:181-633(-)